MTSETTRWYTRRVKRRHEHALAVLVAVAVAVTGVVGSQFYTFRLFFSWPSGGTWANTVASIEDGALFAFSVWYARDVVGRHLARWWASHHQPHRAAHTEEIRAHLSSELVSFEERIRSELAAHHDRILGSINGNGSAGGHDGPS